ncbi:hypothetical protein IWX90DRAFT_154376 [Phyllosticta citrichinensis]|uniref:Uncharacterized protein n=1 Tax=Phyllosticta citrichinensis TaxID=1130410 RepID=A0ABR1XZP5_9PEZI
MNNFNNNSNRNNPPPRPSYPAGPRGNGNGNGNGGPNPPGGYSSYSYPRGDYGYNHGYQYPYGPYYPRNAPSHHNPNVNPPAAQWRAHQPGQVNAMPVTRSANRLPPMDNQHPAAKPSPDQPKRSKPTSLDVDTLIQEESAKAKAKAAIDATKGNNSLSSADKESANGGQTTRSQVRGSMFAPNRLPARVDSPMRFPANTTPSNLDSPPDKGPSASASQPTMPAEGPTISGANSIPVGTSKGRHGSARNVDEAPSSHDQDIRDWLILSGFHDVNLRNERLQSFRQMTAEERSVVPDIEQNRRSASRPQAVKEASPDEVYMGKVKDLAKKMRSEFPPELLRELAAMETPREPGPPENLYNRVTSKADAREMAKEMAKRIDTSK